MTDKSPADCGRSSTSFQEQSTELQIILDSVPAWIFYKDAENRFLRVNRAFCEIMGMSRGELEGRSLFDLFPREQAEAYWKDDREVMASSEPKRNILESMQHKGQTLWARTDKIPYRDAQGHVIGIIGFTLDITARKRAEDELYVAYAEEKRIRQENEQLVGQLRTALERIRTLNELLPICAVCKKIRDEKGEWHFIETYISAHTDTEFTHGYCPECAAKAMAAIGKGAARREPGTPGE